MKSVDDWEVGRWRCGESGVGRDLTGHVSVACRVDGNAEGSFVGAAAKKSAVYQRSETDLTGIKLGYESIASTAIMSLVSIVRFGRERPISSSNGKGISCYIGVAAIVHGNSVGAVITITAEIARIKQVGPEGSDFCNISIKKSRIGTISSVAGGKIGRIRHTRDISIAAAIYGQATCELIAAATEIG